MQSIEHTPGVMVEKKCIRILHLEDSSADAELVRSRLRKEGLRCDITLTSGKSSFEAALAGEPFDLILSDHSIPGYDGFAALRCAQEAQPLTPVIMLSGALDDAQAVESLRSGATDYILKEQLPRLAPAIHRALHEAEERKRQLAAGPRIREQGDLLGLTVKFKSAISSPYKATPCLIFQRDLFTHDLEKLRLPEKSTALFTVSCPAGPRDKGRGSNR